MQIPKFYWYLFEQAVEKVQLQIIQDILTLTGCQFDICQGIMVMS